jgi:copper resistance protein B
MSTFRSLLFFIVLVAGGVPLAAQHTVHGAQGGGVVVAPMAGQLPHVTNGWIPPVDDRMRFNYVQADRFEFSAGDGPNALTWDVQGWYGGDRQKFWWKTEGEQTVAGKGEGSGEIQTLYSRLIAPFWDLQTGLRFDRSWGPGVDRERSFAVLGLEGLAPYWFELEPALFLSKDGDLSARLSATYDALLTQKLILQPRMEANAAFREAAAFGVGKGVNDVELGVRLRYEIRREIAPYIGVVWSKQLGRAADFRRLAGEPTEDIRLVFGVRAWW